MDKPAPPATDAGEDSARARSGANAEPGATRPAAWIAPLAYGFFGLLAAGALAFAAALAPFQAQHLLANLSMSPTIEPSDSFLVSRLAYLRSPPQRGDVIVFAVAPRDNGKRYYAGRIVGVPGDRVQLVASRLQLNGRAVAREPVRPPGAPGADSPSYRNSFRETLPGGASYEIYDAFDDAAGDDTAAYPVPHGCYFVLGDNRDNAVDSRDAHTIGCVPRAAIVGQASYIYDAIWRPRVGRKIR
ncbi:Peptidase S24-like [Lysobacter sp. yr284]|uniref:signal peptidase I n=1 Tax=Lysobacter sp. yr284 TaxID=1761791 RepID=UPI000898B747|nr:signal peptidase I [Lysobacter sp. yr284]SDY79424.1 Peptidase S24-like [Lysobacter sp. yr284]